MAGSRLPRVGQDVIIRWIDSGAGSTGTPKSHEASLVIARTHGEVTYVGVNPDMHAVACEKRCRCTYIELAMCSYGDKDSRTDLAAIWAHAIVDWK